MYSEVGNIPFIKSRYSYTPYFCEENIWLLGKSLMREGISSETLSVLILSNAERQVPLFQQSNGDSEGVTLWDYHVILLSHEKGNPSFIFDFASKLPFPSPLSHYIQHTFPLPEMLPPSFYIYIRMIPLAAYHQYFSSDRSHMLSADGIPLEPFPSYPPLLNKQSNPYIDLQEYLDMNKDLPDESQVFPYDQLIHTV